MCRVVFPAYGVPSIIIVNCQNYTRYGNATTYYIIISACFGGPPQDDSEIELGIQ